jgi:hypothetical protein
LDSIERLHGSVFTSLPDISEITNIFNSKLVSNDNDNDSMNKDEMQLKVVRLYKEWFTNIVKKIFMKLDTGAYAIFLQSDVRVFDNNFKGNKVIDWIDKSHLISLAMNEVDDMKLMWHKIVTTSENTSRSSAGRPSYSHLVCYCKGLNTKYNSDKFYCPDVFYRGDMLWAKGIGINTALLGCTFLKNIANTDCIIDPFCGVGTVLAMANCIGVNSIGIEISSRRCRKAKSLSLYRQLDEMKPSLRRQMGLLDYTPSMIVNDNGDPCNKGNIVDNDSDDNDDIINNDITSNKDDINDNINEKLEV